MFGLAPLPAHTYIISISFKLLLLLFNNLNMNHTLVINGTRYVFDNFCYYLRRNERKQEHNSSISQPKNKEKIFNIGNKLEFQYW